MPWIGMYIAAASAVCSLAMAADAFNGFRSKKLWFPCKYFALNATSLTLLAVTMKFTVDLTTKMVGLAKFSSLVLMSTAMSNSMTSLASMDNNELLLNLTALTILVFTIAGNVCIYYIQIDFSTWLLFEMIVVIVIIFLLLIILYCSSLVIPTAKRYIDSKYHEMHKIARVEGGDCRLTIDEMRIMIRRYWVMAETGSPQFVMARSVLSATSGLICLSMALTLVEAHIRLNMLYFMSYPLTKTNYKWSIMWILYIQSSGVVLGTIAPVSRWFFAFRFKISETGLKNLKDELKIERYWTLRLVEWRESLLHLRIRHHRCRKLLHDAKRLLLNICIGVQILVVLTSKLILLISAIYGNVILLSFHHIKILKRPDPRASDEGSDLNPYVLLLEGEGELPKKILTNICNEVDKLIQTGRRRQPMNLLKLLNMSKNFDGVIKFDDNKEVPSLHSQEPHNCWSLSVVTLASIATALPNISKHKFNESLSGVSEGLYFVKLIEKYMDGDGELTSIRNAADVVWVGVELYNKWHSRNESKLPKLYARAARTIRYS
ncbi:hypothetical protein BUALT_Bualt07G0026900 [Buddleja alternifolia]|uniref:Uncharacterized protein n=1 Tax=Buddleja alternifolia TaxID=168488 RepID=A0AAV6X8K8_9LAMI|nr:hypothetical protein BUALT_Bualt07G0026900 [Buddleja alternifolia]